MWCYCCWARTFCVLPYIFCYFLLSFHLKTYLHTNDNMIIIQRQYLYTSLRTLALGSLVLAMVCSVAYIIRPLSISTHHQSEESTSSSAIESMTQQQPIGDYFLNKAYVTIINNELEVFFECLQYHIAKYLTHKVQKDQSSPSIHVFAV